MPIPTVISAPSQAETASRRLLFISYSHRNAQKYAEEFHRFLLLEIKGQPNCPYRETDIFFDRNGLKAGDYWDESIQAALEQAGALIFLVSDDSLSSEYCRERELRIAVQRGLLVIPVVLCACPWDTYPLPGDALKRSIGALSGVPKDDNSHLIPISRWKDRKDGWDRCVDQIVRALSGGMQRETQTPVPVQKRASPLPPLLPYFCNQEAVEKSFNEKVEQWAQSALILFMKGTLDDRLPRFWERLKEKNLTGFAQLTGRTPILEERPFRWPTCDGTRTRKNLIAAVLTGLSDALTGNPFAIRAPSDLSAKLREFNGVVPLIASLPNEPLKELSATLRALIDLLEACPEDTPLHRLVIAFFIESEDLLKKSPLAKALKLRKSPRLHLVELEPLRELEDHDVRDWYRMQRVDQYLKLNEPTLLDEIFTKKERNRIRFRRFEEELDRLQSA